MLFNWFNFPIGYPWIDSNLNERLIFWFRYKFLNDLIFLQNIFLQENNSSQISDLFRKRNFICRTIENLKFVKLIYLIDNKSLDVLCLKIYFYAILIIFNIIKFTKSQIVLKVYASTSSSLLRTWKWESNAPPLHLNVNF